MPELRVPDSVYKSCGTNKTFCEAVPDYPLIAIETLVERQFHGMDLDQFNRHLVAFGSVSFDSEMNKTDVIFDFSFDDAPMCYEKNRNIRPLTGQLSDNTWALIVNTDKLQQVVQIVECEEPGGECNYFRDIDYSRRSTCRTKYSTRLLLGMLKGETRIKYLSFSFPSCCLCYIGRIGSAIKRSSE